MLTGSCVWWWFLQPRGFGFVTFTDEESVEAVLVAGPLQALHEKQIEIKRAVPRDQMPAPRAAPARGVPTFMPYGRAHPYGYPQPYQVPCAILCLHRLFELRNPCPATADIRMHLIDRAPHRSCPAPVQRKGGDFLVKTSTEC